MKCRQASPGATGDHTLSHPDVRCGFLYAKKLWTVTEATKNEKPCYLSVGWYYASWWFTLLNFSSLSIDIFHYVVLYWWFISHTGLFSFQLYHRPGFLSGGAVTCCPFLVSQLIHWYINTLEHHLDTFSDTHSVHTLALAYPAVKTFISWPEKHSIHWSAGPWT